MNLFHHCFKDLKPRGYLANANNVACMIENLSAKILGKGGRSPPTLGHITDSTIHAANGWHQLDFRTPNEE